MWPCGVAVFFPLFKICFFIAVFFKNKAVATYMYINTDYSPNLHISSSNGCPFDVGTGKRLLVGGDFIQLWSCEEYQGQKSLLEDSVFWTCIWACKYVTKVICRPFLSRATVYE